MAEYSATCSGRNTEAIGEIKDFETKSVPVEESEVMDLVATALSTADKINEILDQLNEVISDTKHMLATTGMRTKEIMTMALKTIPVSSTDEVGEIMKQSTEELSVSEMFETLPLLCAGRVCEKPMPNDSTTNVLSDKGIKKMLNDTETSEYENEKMKTPNAEVEMQTVAVQTDCSGSKKRGRKRKIIPPTSDLVMDSINSRKVSCGASFDDIQKHIEETYSINVKALLKYRVNNFIQKSVDDGVLEKAVVTDTRFKIKKE